MKVLGIAAGRKDGNSELLLKMALKAVEEAGHEVSFLRLHDYYIKPCVGCEACTMLIASGKTPKCKYSWEEDDIRFLMDRVQESQAVIVAAPAYHLMPPGYLTVLLNRIHSCGCDNHTGRNNEGDSSKKKICATIGVGGSDWVSLLLPLLNFTATELIGSQMNLVDQMEIHGIPAKGVVSLREDAKVRAAQLGKNVAEALSHLENPGYYGDVVETCPICHTNVLVYRNQRVACAFCDVAGDPVVENGKMIGIKWDGGIEISRWSKHGNRRHDEAMSDKVHLEPGKGYIWSDAQKQILKDTMDVWKDYLDPVVPPKRG